MLCGALSGDGDRAEFLWGKIRARIGTVTNFSPNVVVLERTPQPILFVTVFRLIAGGMDEHRF
jgi:hypothetical protein